MKKKYTSFPLIIFVCTFFMPTLILADLQKEGKAFDAPANIIEHLPLANIDMGIPGFTKFDVSNLAPWHVGFWWITETHMLKDYQMIRSGRELLGDIVLYHKWIVEEKGLINGEECWLINIYPHELPETVDNNHGNEFLYSLALRTSDFTLKKIVSNTRYGDYYVSGQTSMRSELVFEESNPVAFNNVIFPVDIPKLPNNRITQQSPWENGVITYKDERADDESSQTILRFNNGPKEIDAPAMHISLLFRDRLITQYWVSGYPWWAEARMINTDGTFSGVLYSKTIDWKGKDG